MKNSSKTLSLALSGPRPSEVAGAVTPSNEPRQMVARGPRLQKAGQRFDVGMHVQDVSRTGARCEWCAPAWMGARQEVSVRDQLEASLCPFLERRRQRRVSVVCYSFAKPELLQPRLPAFSQSFSFADGALLMPRSSDTTCHATCALRCQGQGRQGKRLAG